MTAFPVATSWEALFLATEMERRAISLYERAQLLSPAPEVANALLMILRDEQRHLALFTALAGAQADLGEQTQFLSAQAAGVLHPGGLMAAAREEAFSDANSLFSYAAREESTAVSRYLAFAELCTGDARDTFLMIAREEEHHLEVLNALLEGSSD